MRALRIAALAACAALSAVPTGGSAAPAPAPQITDPAGDANAVNSQGMPVGGPGNQSTAPASVGSLDIVSVQFTTTGATTTSVVRGKRRSVFTPDGFTVTMTLAAPPDLGVYRVEGAVGACSIFWVQYFNDPAAPGSSLRHNCGSTDSVTAATKDVAVPARVQGNTITWTMKLKALPAGVKLGNIITDLVAESRATLVAVTVPRVDEATSTGTYKIGS